MEILARKSGHEKDRTLCLIVGKRFRLTRGCSPRLLQVWSQRYLLATVFNLGLILGLTVRSIVELLLL